MLGLLAGNEHEVFTGVAVMEKPSGRRVVTHERTRVRFRPLTTEEIARYVATGEPLDKAGAYAAQGLGAIFIAGIRGCYFNVVGLPLARLAQVLKELVWIPWSMSKQLRFSPKVSPGTLSGIF